MNITVTSLLKKVQPLKGFRYAGARWDEHTGEVLEVELKARQGARAEGPEKPTFLEYLRARAVPREVIDGFLRGPSWARFDPELGYVLGNCERRRDSATVGG